MQLGYGLVKTQDHPVMHNGKPTEDRFVRFDSPDTTITVGVTFHDWGSSVSAFPVKNRNTLWDGLPAPEVLVEEDADCRPMYARAIIPCMRLAACDLGKLSGYAKRLKNDLGAVDAVIAAVNTGEKFN